MTVPARSTSRLRFLPLCVGFAGVGLTLLVLGGQPGTLAQDDAAERVSAGHAAGIIGSAHDFSHGGTLARDLCLPCHTPHITAAEAPLLAPGPAATQPTRSYRVGGGALDAGSIVCLSCHDGTVARDVYAGAHAMTWSDRSAGDVRPGSARVANHPVGVAYPDGTSGYHSAAAVVSGGRIRLPDGRIQCTTCHDPHNTHRHPGMLVMPNDGSRLCLSCHRL
jgi:predicted CXXCH cytochrome family protein